MSTRAELSTGEALVGLLEAYGVDTIFGIPGVHNVEMYRALPRSKIKHILVRHEQGAGFMADGYARAMKPAPCSWRTSTCLILERGRARYISTLWTPGMPKMVSTP